MISAYPKIFSIGQDYIRDIFEEEVEVSEKIDGSQFSFAKVNDEVYLRSKGAQLFPEHTDKMFLAGVEYIMSIRDRLPNNIIFYCEYLQRPKHNTLKYNRIPKNHLMLFGAMHTSQKMIENYRDFADILDIEPVPVLFKGKVENRDIIFKLLETESILGGVNIEGIVVKNLHRQFLLGGQPMPVMAGKYVSEGFKEVNKSRWGKEENSKGKLMTFMESFKTEARWEKAIQHLRDSGKLTYSPKDIGSLIKEIHTDIETEEEKEIKEFLWKEFKGQIMRIATSGFPEWYKQKLVDRSFEEEN